MPADFTPEEDYFNGLLIEGGPYTLSQHISRILASGAHFQYVDGNVIEVIRAGKDEVIVFNNGTVIDPPAVKVVAEERPEPTTPVLEKAFVEAAVEVASEPVEEVKTYSVAIGDTNATASSSQAAIAFGEPVLEVKKEVKKETPVEAPGLVDAPPVEEVTPKPAPKPRVQKPKTVVAEKAPVVKKVSTPTEVEDN